MDMTMVSIEDAVLTLLVWIKENGIKVLNVAGKSASKDERIYDVTFAVINNFLKRI
jgi:hypothetical protein